ncbi:MAG: methyltransferase domain-containing protein [Thermoanaerobaculia bacterium]|nr:methyltransferase domain-containing protein [Thermoanaerobaculia bacterium]
MDPSTLRALEEQRCHYEQRAAEFDEKHLGSRINRCHRAKIRRILGHLDVGPEAPVLEVGTGTGIHAAWLLELCPVRYIGVDLSPDMLEIARRRLGADTELIESPAEELPFSDGSFAAAFCSGTLHHVADRSRAVAEMRRVVRPGGRVVVSEPSPWNPLNATAWLTQPVERGQVDMRPAVLSRWFELAGLSVDAVEFFNFTPPRPSFLARPFDAIDRVASKLPGLRRIASMVLIAGTVCES